MSVIFFISLLKIIRIINCIIKYQEVGIWDGNAHTRQLVGVKFRL